MTLTSSNIENEFFDLSNSFAKVPTTIPQRICYVDAKNEAQELYDSAVNEAKDTLEKEQEKTKKLVDDAKEVLDTVKDEDADKIKEAQDNLARVQEEVNKATQEVQEAESSLASATQEVQEAEQVKLEAKNTYESLLKQLSMEQYECRILQSEYNAAFEKLDIAYENYIAIKETTEDTSSQSFQDAENAYDTALEAESIAAENLNNKENTINTINAQTSEAENKLKNAQNDVANKKQAEDVANTKLEESNKKLEDATKEFEKAQKLWDAVNGNITVDDAQAEYDEAIRSKEEQDKVSQEKYNEAVQDAQKAKEAREKLKSVFMVYSNDKFWGGFGGHYSTTQVFGAYFASLCGLLERLCLGVYSYADGAVGYDFKYENDFLNDAFPATKVNLVYYGREFITPSANYVEQWYSDYWVRNYVGLKSMVEGFVRLLTYPWDERELSKVVYKSSGDKLSQYRTKLGNEYTTLKQQYDNAKTQFDEVCSKLNEAKNNYSTAKSEYENAMNELIELEEALANYKDELNNANSEKVNAGDNEELVSYWDSEIDKLESVIYEYQEYISEAEKTQAKKEEEYISAKTNLDSAQNTYDKDKKSLTELEEEVKKAEEKSNKANSEDTVSQDLGGYILPLTIRRGEWNDSKWTNKTPSANELIPAFTFSKFTDEETLMDEIGETLQYLLFLGEHTTENAVELGKVGYNSDTGKDFDDQGHLFRWIKKFLNLSSNWKEKFLCTKETINEVNSRANKQISAANSIYEDALKEAEETKSTTIKECEKTKKAETEAEDKRHKDKLQEIDDNKTIAQEKLDAAQEKLDAAQEELDAAQEKSTTEQEQEKSTHQAKTKAITLKYNTSIRQADIVYKLEEAKAKRIQTLIIQDSESDIKKVQTQEQESEQEIGLAWNVWYEGLPSKVAIYKNNLTEYKFDDFWTKPEAVYFMRAAFDTDEKMMSLTQTILDASSLKLFRRMLCSVYGATIKVANNPFTNYGDCGPCGVASPLSLYYDGKLAPRLTVNAFPWAYITAAMGRLAPIGCVVYLNTSTNYQEKTRGTKYNSYTEIIPSPRLKYYHKTLDVGMVVYLTFGKNPKYDEHPLAKNLIYYNFEYPEIPDVAWSVENTPRENIIEQSFSAVGGAYINGGDGCSTTITFLPWAFAGKLQEAFEKNGITGVQGLCNTAEPAGITCPSKVVQENLAQAKERKEEYRAAAEKMYNDNCEALDKYYNDIYEETFADWVAERQHLETEYNMCLQDAINMEYTDRIADYNQFISDQQVVIDEANKILETDPTNKEALDQIDRAQIKIKGTQHAINELESNYDNIVANIKASDEGLKLISSDITALDEKFENFANENNEALMAAKNQEEESYKKFLEQLDIKEKEIESNSGTIFEIGPLDFVEGVAGGSVSLLNLETWSTSLPGFSYETNLDDITHTIRVGVEALVPSNSAPSTSESTTSESTAEEKSSIEIDVGGFKLFPHPDITLYTKNNTLHSFWNASMGINKNKYNKHEIIKSPYSAGLKSDENAKTIKQEHVNIAKNDFDTFMSDCLQSASKNDKTKKYLSTEQEITSFASEAIGKVPKKQTIQDAIDKWMKQIEEDNLSFTASPIYICFLQAMTDGDEIKYNIYIGYESAPPATEEYHGIYDETNHIMWRWNDTISLKFDMTLPSLGDVWKLDGWTDAESYSAQADFAGMIGTWDWDWKSIIYND